MHDRFGERIRSSVVTLVHVTLHEGADRYSLGKVHCLIRHFEAIEACWYNLNRTLTVLGLHALIPDAQTRECRTLAFCFVSTPIMDAIIS